jgi:SrtB family sortase
MTGLLNLLAIAGSHILSAIAGLMAVSMISYSGYVIYDSVHTEQAAFTSWDLEQYRPVQEEEEGGLSFDSLFALNSDAVGWIKVEDTHIDYPLVQGADDLEYSYKDVYGETSLTGSIYLASANQRDLSDSYNLIYGHHMTNGAMFGDIEKYESRDFFDAHKTGVLLTGDSAYDLHFFAFTHADAYDSRIYGVGDRDEASMRDFLDYIRSGAMYWEEGLTTDELAGEIGIFRTVRDENIEENGTYKADKMPSDPSEYGTQIVALSTCRAASTNGRQVLFATMHRRTAPVPTMMIYDSAVPLSADGNGSVLGANRGLFGNQVMGHGQGESWSFINLLCVLMMIYFTLPLLQLVSKFGRVRLMKKANEEAENSGTKNIETELKDDGAAAPEHYNEKNLLTRNLAGFIIEALIATGSAVWFIRTENIFSNISMVNAHTPIFLLLFAALWLTDVLCFRYKPKLPFADRLQPKTAG